MSKRESNEPSLPALAFVLRHKETWPTGFEWNFSNCRHCAMGMAHRLWPDVVREPDMQHMCEVFDLSNKDARFLFHSHYLPLLQWTTFPISWGMTPEVIADRIDKYCIKHERCA